ncbi:duodenase-1-like [Nyctibius grandis]|uniref:duodenase-1-like n=1 Tax=Nyctibius grandis TaxID=48427 RepID=UPI0035BC9320
MMLLLLLISAFLLVSWAGAGRITGGSEAKAHSWTCMARLLIQNVSDESACGGFLIHQDAVLSAAPCVAGIMNITLILGDHNVKRKELSQQKFHVGRWVIHPNYSGNILGSPPTHFPSPMNLFPLPMLSLLGTVCKVAGWGEAPITGETSNVLMERDLKVQCEEMCEMPFKHYQPVPTICAGDENGKKTTFHGHSGGPLVCNGKAHGIVSSKHEYCIFSEVFTRVSYFEPWIHEELRKFALQDLPDSPSPK